jgi:DNA-directed RNA polymerase sigma subunit (sigma70/sigma32)
MNGEQSGHGAAGPSRKKPRRAESVRKGDRGCLARFRADGEPAAPALGPRDLRERVRDALRSLSPRESEALQLRFGIDGAALGLERVGRHPGVDAEGAARVEADALRKLRRARREGREGRSFGQ